MKLKITILLLVSLTLASNSLAEKINSVDPANKNIVYLVSDQKIPFWDIMWRGVASRANKLGYNVTFYCADNSAKKELQNTVRAIKGKVDGIILSPTNSSASVTVLKLIKKAGIPVVISDVGTDGGDYISYISSDNKGGAYQVGRILAKKMHALHWQDGTVGIIAIPQKRANGQARTAGFMQAMNEAGIKGAGIKQQVTFSYKETYNFSKALIEGNRSLRAIWLQGSDRYQAALDAISKTGKKDEVLLVTFDAEPLFLELIPTGVLLGAGMQQPFLMGEKAVDALHQYLSGQAVEKEKKLPVLAISADNITQKLPMIRRNVLGLEKR